MKKMIAGICVGVGVASTFVMWCCVRCGALYDRMNGITDDMGETMNRVNDTVTQVNRIIGYTDDVDDLEFDDALDLSEEDEDFNLEDETNIDDDSDEYDEKIEAAEKEIANLEKEIDALTYRTGTPCLGKAYGIHQGETK